MGLISRYANNDDGIDQTIVVAQQSLLGPTANTQSDREQWAFVDVQSQNQMTVRKFVRAHTARRRERKKRESQAGEDYNDDAEASQYRRQARTVVLETSFLFHNRRTSYSERPEGNSQQRLSSTNDLYKSKLRETQCRPLSQQSGTSTSADKYLYPQRLRVTQTGPTSLLGAGRIDPFNSFPTLENSTMLHECFDYFTTFYLPCIHPIDESGNASPLSKAWIPIILSSPLLFHSCMVSSSTTLGILRGTSAYSVFRLYHKGEVLKKLREAIQENTQSYYSIEEIIMAINTLAVESGMLMPEKDDSPFNTPLASIGLVDVYSRLVYDQRHGQAIGNLIAKRGGLHKLRLPYLGSLISGNAVVAATKALKSSPFPYIPPFIEVWKRNQNPDIISKAPSRRGKLLQKLAIFGFSQEALGVSYDLYEQTELIEGYCQGKIRVNMLEGYTVKYRSIKYNVQHRLISLPRLDEQPVYESYRLTLWIYSFAVTTAIRLYLRTRQELVQRLLRALMRTQYDSSWSLLPETLLWILFFGGIAAAGLPERTWFVERASSLLFRLGLKDWEEVKPVLHSFLWLDRACDSGGKAFWLEVSHLLNTVAGGKEGIEDF